MKNYYVYILTNYKNTVLYTGVTNNLQRRIYEHKEGINKGFSKKYGLKKLVFFETYDRADKAIAREKQLKNWKKEWKKHLIQKENPKYLDLSLDWTSIII